MCLGSGNNITRVHESPPSYLQLCTLYVAPQKLKVAKTTNVVWGICLIFPGPLLHVFQRCCRLEQGTVRSDHKLAQLFACNSNHCCNVSQQQNISEKDFPKGIVWTHGRKNSVNSKWVRQGSECGFESSPVELQELLKITSRQPTAECKCSAQISTIDENWYF